MFSDNERLIFTYSNGEQDIHADPLELRRKLLVASAGEFNQLWARLNEPAVDEMPPEPSRKEGEQGSSGPLGPLEVARLAEMMDRLECQEKVVLAVRQAFGLPSLDPQTGKGVTERMCWRVLATYLDVLEGNVKRGES